MSARDVDVVLYERPGCHLCEDAAAALAPLLRELGARLTRVNVGEDPALEARYGLAIPVVTVDGLELTRAPIDLGALGRALAGGGAN